jgi:hypothetical protein
LNTWLDNPDPALRDAASRELLARADLLLKEVASHPLPPDPIVHAMVAEFMARLGFRASEGRSLTAWLRQHAPEVAGLWPEAPLGANWLDWRLHVGADHVDVLDWALAAVSVPRRPEGTR